VTTLTWRGISGLRIRDWALLDFHVLMMLKVFGAVPALPWKIVIVAGVFNLLTQLVGHFIVDDVRD
jgi:hypothetical protein